MKRWNRLAAGWAMVAGIGSSIHSQELTSMHPSYTYASIMPAGFNPAGIGGLDFLGNDGVICTWGGSQKTAGEVHILPGLATANPGAPVKIDQSLREPLGLRVVGGEIFVLTKPELFKYSKQTDGTWKRSSVSRGWAYTDSQWHHFAFGLVHHQGSFYFATGTAYVLATNAPDDNEDPQRGSVIKVNPANGEFQALVKGLRNPNGLSVGPDGELFTTDNEGHWVPTNKVVHIKEGRFYGFQTSRNYTPGTVVTPPALWLSYSTYSNSPSRMLLLKDGPYQGQMLAGDVNHGGIQRYFLEKVQGEYQGAAFRFAQGIPYGINELVPGPDGNLYVAGIGGGCCGMEGSNNWNYNGKNNGLGRLMPTSTVPFEILAMRSVTGGFELEFTAPVVAAASAASHYVMQSWTNIPQAAYGRGKDMEKETATQITQVELSGDRRKVTLTVGNLRTNRVYYVKVGSGVTREGGGGLRSGEAWYTLNKLGPGVTHVPESRDFPRRLVAGIRPGAGAIVLPFTQPYRVELRGLDGRRFGLATGAGPGSLDIRGVPSGVYALIGRVGASSFSRKVRIP